VRIDGAHTHFVFTERTGNTEPDLALARGNELRGQLRPWRESDRRAKRRRARPRERHEPI